MLAPSLATMLCVVTTDAVATAQQLDEALRHATRMTFDRLDVDGATSTNDTVLLLSSGASSVTPSQDELNAAVLAVCDDLAEQMMADAEGVTKRVRVTVSGAASEQDALVAARTVARDSLVKTALFGSDPTGAGCLPRSASLPSTSTRTGSRCRSTAILCASTRRRAGARAEVDLSGMDIDLTIALGVGEHSASIRTTDLSHAYVEENSAYSS
ncbi:hypothetical protein GTG23_30380 [Rhodococcus hoagii]|nr:hypothetical protein [Prescottella equi]